MSDDRASNTDKMSAGTSAEAITATSSIFWNSSEVLLRNSDGPTPSPKKAYKFLRQIAFTVPRLVT